MPLQLHAILDPVVRLGLVDPDRAALIRRDVQANGIDPVRALTLHARIPSSVIFQAVAVDKGIDFIGKERFVFRRDLADKVPAALIRRKAVLPMGEEDREVLLAVGDVEAIDDGRLRETLRGAFDKGVRFALADPDDLRAFIERALDGSSGSAAIALSESAVDFVEGIMREAFIRRASDIHLEPAAEGFRIRFRVDGELMVFRDRIPAPIALAALSRLKVLAQMDIAENREPQDGSLVYELAGSDGWKFDIRMASAPTKHGERATLRLLGTETRDLTLGVLGFTQDMYATFREMIRRPSGLILLTGPTGSGKSTTLYAALREISDPSLNIMTIEDPVEYSIPGVSQIEVDDFGKVTFSSALRSLLRHDPDVLMVGEIRDKETADMALRASVTGHLVLSTLHTNTAIGAVTRLVDMGCEPYMVAATLIASISQRLVRRLCPSCKSPRPKTPEEAVFLGEAPDGTRSPIYEPRGCLRCQRTGFLGRIGVFETFLVDGAAREAIAAGANEKAVERVTRRLTPIRRDAAAKVLAGLTTLNDIQGIAAIED